MSTKQSLAYDAALDSWEVLEPPADFADRVLDSVAADPELAHAETSSAVDDVLPDPTAFRPTRWRFVAAAAAAVALAAGGLGAVKYWMAKQAEGETHELAPANPKKDEDELDPEDRMLGAGKPLPERVDVGPLPTELSSRIDTYVNAYGRNFGSAFKFHGQVLVSRGDETVVRSFGYAKIPEKTPHSERPRFLAGSLTQPMVAIVTARLAERELIDLNDPVSAYLPGYPSKAQADVRIHELLSHSSGIPNISDVATYQVDRYFPQSTDNLLSYFHELELEFEPGSQFEPSNSNYVLLGAVLEAVTGEPLAEVMQRELFEPANMDDTTFGAMGDDVAFGYEFNEAEFLQPSIPVDVSAAGGAAGVVTTTDDLLAMHRALEDGTLLPRESQGKLFTVVQFGYGLGFVIDGVGGRRVALHPGGIDGYNGQFARVLEDGTFVAVLANTEVVDARQVAADVLSLAYDQKVEPPTEPVAVPLSAKLAEQYAGHYSLAEHSRKRYERFVDPEQLAVMDLVHIHQIDSSLWMRMAGINKRLHAESDTRFFFKDHAVTRAMFIVRDGEVVELVLKQGETEFVLEPTAKPAETPALVEPSQRTTAPAR